MSTPGRIPRHLPTRDAAARDAARRTRVIVLAERGQASVEVVGFLPIVALIALAAFTAISARAADEQAGEAAEAAALVLLQGGGEPRAAAKAALPEAARRRATVTVSGTHVHVRVRPRLLVSIPGLAERLAGDAHADAGRLSP